MTDTIRIEDRGRGRVLTLSNPGERNALTGRMRQELMAALMMTEDFRRAIEDFQRRHGG